MTRRTQSHGFPVQAGWFLRGRTRSAPLPGTPRSTPVSSAAGKREDGATALLQTKRGVHIPNLELTLGFCPSDRSSGSRRHSPGVFFS